MANLNLSPSDQDALDAAVNRFKDSHPESKNWDIQAQQGQYGIDVLVVSERLPTESFTVSTVIDMEESFFTALEQHWVESKK